jgi:3-hydroxyisobutyrate dehydrogenase-like beta-hydroxyacid dehydrogenase
LPFARVREEFSVEYAPKDLAYALRLGRSIGVDARGANTVDGWFAQAMEAGDVDLYHPIISRHNMKRILLRYAS